MKKRVDIHGDGGRCAWGAPPEKKEEVYTGGDMVCGEHRCVQQQHTGARREERLEEGGFFHRGGEVVEVVDYGVEHD